MKKLMDNILRLHQLLDCEIIQTRVYDDGSFQIKIYWRVEGVEYCYPQIYSKHTVCDAPEMLIEDFIAKANKEIAKSKENILGLVAIGDSPF